MATATNTGKGKSTGKGQPKPQAVLDSINVEDAIAEDDMPVAPARRSKWTELLDQLSEMTEAGKIPRDDEGELKFVRLGKFTNVNGARTQAKALNDRDDGAYAEVYEFKSVTKQGGSELFGRVREVEAEEGEGEDAE